MKIAYITLKNEKPAFFSKLLVEEILEMEEPEKIDNQILELKAEKYNTIILSNQVASFSEDMIRKYSKDKSIRIIILPEEKNKK